VSRRALLTGADVALLVAVLATVAAGPARAQDLGYRFVDASEEAGVDFVYLNGASGERYMQETMGSGLGLVDLDVDGWLDLYFAQGAPSPGHPEGGASWRNELLRGLPGGRFTHVPDLVGVGSDRYADGIAIADYDNDGFPDLFVGNFGPDELYRNNGDGTFTEVGARLGLDSDAWAFSAAWGDLDNDGDLDLYVVNYVDFSFDNHKFCGNPQRQMRAYCHPDVYNAQADLLYRNEGDGTFTEIGLRAGIADTLDGKGLGVMFADYDDDGDTDIYVANDSTRNFLYTNQGDGTFVEDGLLAGVAFNEDGQAEAGMGVDWGDYDGDGDLDVVVTNLDLETNSLYQNLGDGGFADVSFAAGIGEPSLLDVGFGIHWFDPDNDADLDLFVTNGHIIDNIADFRDNLQYAQRNHLFVNDGTGEMTERSTDLGPGMQLVKVGRGSAVADVDHDGDLDVAVTNNVGRADYLRNEGGNTAGQWIQLRLVGVRANRTAAGARVRVLTAGRPPQLREVAAGNSFCSVADPLLHIGLGPATRADVEIRWPGGETVTIEGLEAGHMYVVREARGVVASRGPLGS
jgi:hypothetical protein